MRTFGDNGTVLVKNLEQSADVHGKAVTARSGLQVASLVQGIGTGRRTFDPAAGFADQHCDGNSDLRNFRDGD